MQCVLIPDGIKSGEGSKTHHDENERARDEHASNFLRRFVKNLATAAIDIQGDQGKRNNHDEFADDGKTHYFKVHRSPDHVKHIDEGKQYGREKQKEYALYFRQGLPSCVSVDSRPEFHHDQCGNFCIRNAIGRQHLSKKSVECSNAVFFCTTSRF